MVSKNMEHGLKGTFVAPPHPPSPSKAQKHEKGLPKANAGGIGKCRFHCENASDIFRPHYAGEI